MNEPPPEILKAADRIHQWAVVNGHKHWRIGAVASRKYCERLMGELHKARALLHKFATRYAGAEHAQLDKAQAEALVKAIDKLLRDDDLG